MPNRGAPSLAHSSASLLFRGELMRVYLPFTMPALAKLLAAAETSAPPLRGFAATPALRLLHSDPSAPHRRVVLAAEVPDQHVSGIAGFDEPALVEVRVPVALVDVVSG